MERGPRQPTGKEGKEHPMHMRTVTRMAVAKADSFSPVISKIQEVVTLADSMVLTVADAKATVGAFTES